MILSFSLEKSPTVKLFCHKRIILSFFNAIFSFSFEKSPRKNVFGHLSMQFFDFLSKNRPKKKYFAVFRCNFSIVSRKTALRSIILPFSNAIFPCFTKNCSERNYFEIARIVCKDTTSPSLPPGSEKEEKGIPFEPSCLWRARKDSTRPKMN